MAGREGDKEGVRGIAEVAGRAVSVWTTTRGRQDGGQAGGRRVSSRNSKGGRENIEDMDNNEGQ